LDRQNGAPIVVRDFLVDRPQRIGRCEYLAYLGRAVDDLDAEQDRRCSSDNLRHQPAGPTPAISPLITLVACMASPYIMYTWP
jgi:hypothetical protein